MLKKWYRATKEYYINSVTKKLEKIGYMDKKKGTEEKLKKMLEASSLPLKASYNSQEVCEILAISIRQFWRLVDRYEVDETGKILYPDSLDSYMLRRHKRITFPELIAFLERNQSYERIYALESGPVQLEIW